MTPVNALGLTKQPIRASFSESNFLREENCEALDEILDPLLYKHRIPDLNRQIIKLIIKVM